VRFGGKAGKTVDVKAGDVVILPAGTGHIALSLRHDGCKGADFIIVDDPLKVQDKDSEGCR
jgi:uncharacterized protein YjlB